MKIKLLLSFLLLSTTLMAQNKIPSKEWQINTAVLALEEAFRSEAKVYGYDANGDFVVLREGTNQYISLADDPKKDGFHIAAYHKDLDEFMARGRELKKQGKNFKEIFDTREEEVKSGKLKIPYGSTLIILRGDVNEETKQIENEKVRYVVYTPFATTESTGLPTKPRAGGHAWIMNPGTHRAHIMITPTYPKKEKG